MEVQLHSTTKIVELVLPDGSRCPARIWEGVTAGGVKCHAYVTRIAVAFGDNADEFERELKEQAAPTPEIQRLPLSMIL